MAVDPLAALRVYGADDSELVSLPLDTHYFQVSDGVVVVRATAADRCVVAYAPGEWKAVEAL